MFLKIKTLSYSLPSISLCSSLIILGIKVLNILLFNKYQEMCKDCFFRVCLCSHLLNLCWLILNLFSNVFILNLLGNSHLIMCPPIRIFFFFCSDPPCNIEGWPYFSDSIANWLLARFRQWSFLRGDWMAEEREKPGYFSLFLLWFSTSKALTPAFVGHHLTSWCQQLLLTEAPDFCPDFWQGYRLPWLFQPKRWW